MVCRRCGGGGRTNRPCCCGGLPCLRFLAPVDVVAAAAAVAAAASISLPWLFLLSMLCSVPSVFVPPSLSASQSFARVSVVKP
eukprot:COSAG02_NODE_1077_length_14724_cov_11.027145_4_plen_83_part_00